MKFCGEVTVKRGPGRNILDFGGSTDSFLDPGSFPGLGLHKKVLVYITALFHTMLHYTRID